MRSGPPVSFHWASVIYIDLAPDNPLIMSPTPGRIHTWRYFHWMWVNDELWVYAEVEKENRANEIRLYRLSR